MCNPFCMLNYIQLNSVLPFSVSPMTLSHTYIYIYICVYITALGSVNSVNRMSVDRCLRLCDFFHEFHKLPSQSWKMNTHRTVGLLCSRTQRLCSPRSLDNSSSLSCSAFSVMCSSAAARAPKYVETVHCAAL